MRRVASSVAILSALFVTACSQTLWAYDDLLGTRAEMQAQASTDAGDRSEPFDSEIHRQPNGRSRFNAVCEKRDNKLAQVVTAFINRNPSFSYRLGRDFYENTLRDEIHGMFRGLYGHTWPADRDAAIATLENFEAVCPAPPVGGATPYDCSLELQCRKGDVFVRNAPVTYRLDMNVAQNGITDMRLEYETVGGISRIFGEP